MEIAIPNVVSGGFSSGSPSPVWQDSDDCSQLFEEVHAHLLPCNIIQWDGEDPAVVFWAPQKQDKTTSHC